LEISYCLVLGPVDNDTTNDIKVTLSYIKLSSSQVLSAIHTVAALDAMGTTLDSSKCSRVGFFPSSTPEHTVFGLTYLFIAVAVILTFFLRRMVKDPTTPTSTETESPSGDEESPPPPYSPPEEPNPAPPPPLYPRPSAASFVLATFLLSVQLLAVIALAFSIQFSQHCRDPDDDSHDSHHVVTSHVFAWIFYGVVVLYASSGSVAWVVLLGSLWSPWKKEVMLDIVTIGVFVLVGVPLVLLWQILMAPVKACQGKKEKEGEEEGDGKGEGLQDEKGEVEGLHSSS
jgi:hypothetical protein